MRELTLLETGYLVGGLMLSLVLPLLMGFRVPAHAPGRKSCLRVVWVGQSILALAVLAVLASPLLAPFAAGLGLLGCVACLFVLLRRCQGVNAVDGTGA